MSLEGSVTFMVCLLRDATAEEDSGVEGILSRLERERNIKFAFNSREKAKAPPIRSYDHEDEWLVRTSKKLVSWSCFFKDCFNHHFLL